MELFWIIWIICMLLYFAPTFIGCITGKRNVAAIFVLNLFLGWTFIGWVISLVWSCCKDPIDHKNEEKTKE